MTLAGAFLLILLWLSQRHGDFMWLHVRTSAHDQDGNHNLISLRALGGPGLLASRLGRHPTAQPTLTGLIYSFRLKNPWRNLQKFWKAVPHSSPVSLPTQPQGRVTSVRGQLPVLQSKSNHLLLFLRGQEWGWE